MSDTDVQVTFGADADNVVAAIAALKDQLDALNSEVTAFGGQTASAGQGAADAIGHANTQISAMKQQLANGSFAQDAVQQAQGQIAQLNQSWTASASERIAADRQAWGSVSQNATLTARQVQQVQSDLATSDGALQAASLQDYSAKSSMKVQAATQSKSELMAIAQEVYDHAVSLYGKDSEQAIAAMARVVAAKSAAARSSMRNSDGESDDEAGLTLQSVNEQIKTLQFGLKEQQTILNAEVQQYQITQDQKFAALEGGTEKEYQAELALLQKELAIGDLKVAQAQAIENKISALTQKHSLDMIKIDEQSIAAAQKAWEGYFTTIESGFNSQIKGLISGTTSWSNAFKSVLSDILVKFIETVEKMVFQWAASEIAQTTATTSGAAARVAAESSASALSIAGTIASAIKSIMASSAETFAGIFGFLAPVMGPAAAGPATAGEATVAAVAGQVSAFAQGSWELPSDMVAQIHKGEMIVPAAQTPWAQSLMASSKGAPAAGGSGGDVHVHHATNFNVAALDSRDVKRWITGNGRTILDTINSSVRNGAHLGLSKLGQG